MESLKNLKNRLDRGSMYFWSREADGRFRLVNAFTLKTATGVESRLDALRLTNALNTSGFKVARLEEEL